MKDDQHRFLSLLGQLPARLTAEQAGWVLNCQPHDIPALIHARMLKPLGNPSANGTKYFATADLLEIAKDRGWLVKVTNRPSQPARQRPEYPKEKTFSQWCGKRLWRAAGLVHSGSR